MPALTSRPPSALALLLALTACGPERVELPAPDAGATRPDAGASPADAGTPRPDSGVLPTLEVGTGFEAFEPIVDGAALPLVQGPQGGTIGGSHFWVALRATGVVARGATLAVRVALEDGTIISDQTRTEDLTVAGGAASIAGLRAVIQSCDDVAGKRLTLLGELLDATGLTVRDEARFLGPEGCPDPCPGCD